MYFVIGLVANPEGPFGGNSYEVFIKLLDLHLAVMVLVHQVQIGMVQTYLQHPIIKEVWIQKTPLPNMEALW